MGRRIRREVGHLRLKRLETVVITHEDRCIKH